MRTLWGSSLTGPFPGIYLYTRTACLPPDHEDILGNNGANKKFSLFRCCLRTTDELEKAGDGETDKNNKGTSVWSLSVVRSLVVRWQTNGPEMER